MIQHKRGKAGSLFSEAPVTRDALAECVMDKRVL